MRCLLIGPSEGALGVLPEVLRDAGLEPTSSVELGVGIALATAELNYFNAAVVVIPAKPSKRGLEVLLFETGVAAGRNLPLLIVVPPAQTVPTALANIQVIKTELTNHESLSLHVRLFAQSLGDLPPSSIEASASQISVPLRRELADEFEARLALLSDSTESNRGIAIQQFVVELLSSAGANIESEQVRDNRIIDAAAFIPGEEERLGLLVIEVKDRLDRANHSSAERQLQSYVLSAGAGLGLLLYISSKSKTSTSTTPLVLSMSIKQLLSELREQSIGNVLMHARNVAVHRM